jgi:Protein of unknown function (DUF2840)
MTATPGFVGQPTDPIPDRLTHLELTWLAKRVEQRVRFGRPVASLRLDRHRRCVSFAPNAIFAIVRWVGNNYGTVCSEIDILRAVAPGECCTTVPFVQPGGQLLLSIKNWLKVERVLQAIDAVEALGINPADAAPDHWRHVHNRLIVGERPRSYTLARHRAWLKRRRITP